MIAAPPTTTVPQVDRFTLDTLSPANVYVFISTAVSSTFRECAYLENHAHFEMIQKIITAMVSGGRVRTKTALILDPPEAQGEWPGSYLLARFWLDSEWIKRDGQPSLPIHFRCKLVSGSPRGNKPMTLVLTMVDIEDGGQP